MLPNLGKGGSDSDGTGAAAKGSKGRGKGKGKKGNGGKKGDPSSGSDAIPDRKTRWATRYCYDFADFGKCSKGKDCKFTKAEHMTEAQAKKKTEGKVFKSKKKKKHGSAHCATFVDDAADDAGLGSDAESDADETAEESETDGE